MLYIVQVTLQLMVSYSVHQGLKPLVGLMTSLSDERTGLPHSR